MSTGGCVESGSGPATPVLVTRHTAAAHPVVGLPADSVIRELFEHPWKFDFFEAVLWLQQLATRGGGAPPPPAGRFVMPSEEPIRFTVPATHVFPTAAIQAVGWDEAAGRPQIRVSFMGLTGPSGTLPQVYTERLRAVEAGTRHRERDALRDWLDNFNHRLVALFFEAWAKYRFPVVLRRQWTESRAGSRETPLVHVALSAIAGLDPPRSRRSTTETEVGEASPLPPVRRDELLALAGVLAQRPMTIANLGSALERALGVPIRVRQFEASWLELEEASRTRLGVGNCRLGRQAVVGERIWTRQQKVVVEVGPVARDEFLRFLPPSEQAAASGEGTHDGYRRLCHFVRVCAGTEIEFDVRPILKLVAATETTLSGEASLTRLGIDSWLGTPVGADVADDAVFRGR